MGPLSGKQQREFIALSMKEKREQEKLQREEARKDQLHAVKLSGEAAKVQQSLIQKDDTHSAKMDELGGKATEAAPKVVGPLLAASGSENIKGVFQPQGTDTVPAMLTPGEAIIPKESAQDPANKPIIESLVAQGRSRKQNVTAMMDTTNGYLSNGTPSVEQKGTVPTSTMSKAPVGWGLVEAALKALKSSNTRVEEGEKKAVGYADGSTSVPPMGSGLLQGARKALTTRKDRLQEEEDKAMGTKYYEEGTAIVSPEEAQAVATPVVPQPTVAQPTIVPPVAESPPSLPNQPEKPVENSYQGRYKSWYSENPFKPRPELLNALVGQESNGFHIDPKTGGMLTNPRSGASGITQVMPKTGVDPGYGVSPIKNSSKEEYLRFGNDYLGAMLKKYNGDEAKALAAYNFGPGNLDKTIAAYGDKWYDHVPAETKSYFPKILAQANAGIGKADTIVPTFMDKQNAQAAIQNRSVLADIRANTKYGPGGASKAVADVNANSGGVPPLTPAEQTRQAANLKTLSADPQASNSVALKPLEEVVFAKNPDIAAKVDPVAWKSESYGSQSAIDKAVASWNATPSAGKEKSELSLAGTLKEIFSGFKSLSGLNEQDLTRFAMNYAGSVISGRKPGRALRYAGKTAMDDSMNRIVADARFGNQQTLQKNSIEQQNVALEARDWSATERALQKDGYSMANIQKYKETKNWADLGEPKDIRQKTGGVVDYTFGSGPNAGKKIPFQEVTTRNGKDWIGPNGQSLSAMRMGGVELVPHKDYEEKVQKGITHMVNFAKDVEGAAKDAYVAHLGPTDKNQDKHKMAIRPDQIGQEASAYLKSRGFEIDSPEMQLAAKGITNVAMNNYLNAIKNGDGSNISFQPFMAKAILIGQTGVPSSAFDIGNKQMPTAKIKELIDKADRNPIVKEAATKAEKLEKQSKVIEDLWVRYNADKKKPLGSESESGFYQYAMKNMK